LSSSFPLHAHHKTYPIDYVRIMNVLYDLLNFEWIMYECLKVEFFDN